MSAPNFAQGPGRAERARVEQTLNLRLPLDAGDDALWDIPAQETRRTDHRKIERTRRQRIALVMFPGTLGQSFGKGTTCLLDELFITILRRGLPRALGQTSGERASRPLHEVVILNSRCCRRSIRWSPLLIADASLGAFG
ncbi:MAG TPA: hypothetical protein VH743_09120 [Beijerinckiaceae bacterium]